MKAVSAGSEGGKKRGKERGRKGERKGGREGGGSPVTLLTAVSPAYHSTTKWSGGRRAWLVRR